MAGGAHRVELLGSEAREPACLRRFDDRASIRKEREASLYRPPERIGDGLRAPLTAESGTQRPSRALTAVRHRRLIRFHSSAREPIRHSARSIRGAQHSLERSGADDNSGSIRNLAYRFAVASSDIGLLAVTFFGIAVPVLLALLLPHEHVDSAVVLAIPCGVVAATATAVLAARDRRKAGKEVNRGVIVVYGALVVLGATLLMLTVAAIAFYRTPQAF